MTIETLSTHKGKVNSLPDKQTTMLTTQTINKINDIHMNPIPKGIYGYPQEDTSDIDGTRTRHLGSANYEYPRKK